MDSPASSPNPFSGILGYFYQNLPAEKALILGAPEALAAICFLVALSTFWVTYLYFKRALMNAKGEVNLKEQEIANLKSEISRLQQRLPGPDIITGPTISGLFEIEPLVHKVYWLDQNGDQLDPNPKTKPAGAVRCLWINAKITTIPARIVEDIRLELGGRPIFLNRGSWKSRKIQNTDNYFLNFNLPDDMNPGRYTAKLIALSRDQQKSFPPFDVEVP